MSINAQRSTRWLQTFAQIMEVDRQRPLRARPALKPSLSAKAPADRNRREEKS